MDNRLQVLAVEPFFGGSHRQFLEWVSQISRHQWTLVTDVPVHWKWRMRYSPLLLANKTRDVCSNGYRPDALFCTDMLDLPSYRGLLRDARLSQTPTLIYFHENQWTYPVAPGARVDHHYGYTNLLSAIAADKVVFNSQFHRTDFLSASLRFLQNMPDGIDAHDLEAIAQKSDVIPPGFSPPNSSFVRKENGPLTVGWVARWEHDKRPDQFLSLLQKLEEIHDDWRLVLLGPRPQQGCAELDEISNRFSRRIDFNGYAQSHEDYWRWLNEIDVVVSTADHEYFGIAVCEAIWSGAIPVLPNRLSYPELTVKDCLYDDLEDAVAKVLELRDESRRIALRVACRDRIGRFVIQQTVDELDNAISAFVRSCPA
ncbi:MAG: DUF3524 domain-containing protein [Planctomycetota bacterium]